MPVLHVQLMGEMLSYDGWGDNNGEAAAYVSAGSDYRTWRPTVSDTPEGGLFVSTKIDHIRGYAQDDHCQLEMEFDGAGKILAARAVLDLAETPQFDTGLIKAAGDLYSEKAGKIAEISGKLGNSLMGFLEDLGESGGRANFPAVARYNHNVIAGCVKGAVAESVYDISVVTGDVDSAGTDALVYVALFGANGSSGDVPLVSRRNNFERGQTDGFTPPLLTADLGNLERLRVWLDPVGEKPGWFLESVTVRNRQSGASWFFPCHRWLALDMEDGLVDRILLPETSLTRYEIRVVTGTVDGAGTDANVYLTLRGSNGSSGERLLDVPGVDNFERGSTDEFSLEMADLGDLQELLIRHDNRGKRPGWYLESVTVRNMATGESWFFPCQQWLARDVQDGRIDRRLYPRR